MTTKQVLFRLDDSKLIALDNKLSDKGISKQFFLSKCVELFLEDKLSFDNNVITNDSSEIVELKKQIAVILERLDRIENDSNVIAFDTTIVDDSNELSNDSLSIQSKEDTNQEDITKNIALSESPNLPLNEDSTHNVPLAENEAVNSEIVENDSELGNLSDKERDILLKMKAIESGKIFKSQGELARFLVVGSGDITKLKTHWENTIFSVESINGSNQLTRL